MEFKIREEFLIDGEPVKLVSGAVHYFRIAPTHWYQTLYNLKAMGCNCVETYIPWNLHEPQKGTFDFSGIADVEAFLEVAKELNLYAIVRPSPYICAEWDFGGLPAWLLKDGNMRIRSQYQPYLDAVADYFEELLPRLVPFQFTHGGNVLMMQVENEYGSYGEDKGYLKAIADLMKENGIDVPLFTSDGGWKEALDAGTLAEEGIFPTVNFGSNAAGNFQALKEFQEQHGLNQPYMCMEFWDGWFNNWQEPVIRRDAKETAEEVKSVLKQGSINFYMFQGGTNFGFYNGCSDMGEKNMPQITSYDYDAPLTEWGQPTEKFFEIQKVIQEEVADAQTASPLYPHPVNIGTIPVDKKVSLFSVLEKIAEPVKNDYTLNMEAVGQNFGYLLYRSVLKGKRKVDCLQLFDAQDRAQIFINGQLVATKYQETLSEPISVDLLEESNVLDVLIENTGRNNYGQKLVADTQRKGIRGGVVEDRHYISDWVHYPLDFEHVDTIDFSKDWTPGTPSFYRASFVLDKKEDTFLDCSAYGKGVVFVNGVNVGRYWHEGPAASLFIPDYFFNVGQNEIIIFETEGTEITELPFTDKPKYHEMSTKELNRSVFA